MPSSPSPCRRTPFRASLALAALLPLACWGCNLLGPPDPPPEPKAGEVTVLFIGSSYLAFNDVPDLFKGFARKAGEEVYVRSRLLLGQDLDYFAADAWTTQLLRERDWDFVVLQGGAQNVAYPSGHATISGSGSHPVYPALSELKRKATELSPGTRVVYMMPWAFEDGMLWVEGMTDDYGAMQLKIRATTLKWGGELGLVVAPVGMAFYEVMTTWNPPEHFLFDNDWNHASKEGSFLAAATLFCSVFARSAAELSYKWDLGAALARDLRGVASRTVMDSLALWNIRQ